MLSNNQLHVLFCFHPFLLFHLKFTICFFKLAHWMASISLEEVFDFVVAISFVLLLSY